MKLKKTWIAVIAFFFLAGLLLYMQTNVYRNDDFGRIEHHLDASSAVRLYLANEMSQPAQEGDDTGIKTEEQGNESGLGERQFHIVRLTAEPDSEVQLV